MRNCVEPLQEGLQALRKRDVLTARRRLGNLHSVQNRDRKRTQKRLFPISTCRRRRRHAQAHALVRLRARRTTAHRAARACSTTPTSLARWPHRLWTKHPTNFGLWLCTAGDDVLAVHTRSVRSGLQVAIAAAVGCMGRTVAAMPCAPECSPLLLTIDGWYISRSQRECSNI
jgi:hypothetical protein